MKRLFVAVPVSGEVKDRIKPVLAELSETAADLKLVSFFNLHFTLKFLGDIAEEKIPVIKKKLQKIADDYNTVEVRIKGVGVFPSLEKINVIWIGLEGSSLVPLMKAVNKELGDVKKNGLEEEIPHLTIARVKTGRGKEKLQEFVKSFEKKEFGTMMADKLILYESELTPEGHIYRKVIEFKLG